MAHLGRADPAVAQGASPTVPLACSRDKAVMIMSSRAKPLQFTTQCIIGRSHLSHNPCAIRTCALTFKYKPLQHPEVTFVSIRKKFNVLWCLDLAGFGLCRNKFSTPFVGATSTLYRCRSRGSITAM